MNNLTWRQRAEVVILRVIAECRALDLTDEEIRKRVDAAYPFGERRYYPYTAWLQARRDLLAPQGRGEVARLRAWKNAAPVVDPGTPLSPLEAYLEQCDDS